MTAMDEPNPKSGPDDPQNPYHVSQASRIYFLPNLMTAGNLFCGFVAVIHCIQARLAESSGGEYLVESLALGVVFAGDEDGVV